MKNMTGVISALPTPYTRDLQLDTESLRKLVKFNVDNRVDGLYVGGSTGEAFLQSAEERIAVLETVAEEAKGRLTLIAHIGGISTKESVFLAKAARRCGYDAVSAVTPFYYPFTFNEHLAHYQRIIEAAEQLPMVVYNIPVLSGVKFSPQNLSQLLQLDGVVALKQTSGDLQQMEWIKRTHPDIVLYNGYDEIFASGVMAGADGGIGSTYNLMPWRYKTILASLKNGEVEKAQKIQSKCNEAIDILISSGVLKGIKYILQRMGIIENADCCPPFSSVAAEFYPQLDKLASELMSEYNRP